MLETIRVMLSYDFLSRAFIVGILVSLCAALLGVSLVLKRYSMIGDGLSHVGFGAMAIAAALNIAPLAVAIPTVMVSAFLLLRLSGMSKLRGDSAIALISSGALAVGVMAVSFGSGMNTELNNYMFGSILSLSHGDAVISVVLSCVVLALFILFYPRIFAVTFDETFARSTGIRADVYNMMLAFLTAMTVVLGMRMMGTLLISSLIIFPALSVMRICRRFLSVVILSAVVSVICFIAGIVISYLWATPAGASIVCVNILFFLFFSIAGAVKYGGFRN